MKIFYSLKSFRKEYGLTQQDIANMLNVTKQSISAFENTRKLPDKHKNTLESKFNCKLEFDELFENTNNDIIELERIYINPECGDGVEDYGEPYIEPFKISRQSIKTYLKCTEPENLKIFQASGDSMEDKISDCDWLLVDIGRKDISVSGIYIFKSNNKYRCKRLHISLDGKLHIKSDNKKYEEEVYSPEDNIEIIIIGRVLNNLSKGI